MRILYDIGANCGDYTICNIDKYDKVICVDASQLQCELLEKNVPVYKCVIVHTLVSNSPDAKFYRCNASGLSSASMEWISGKGRFAPGNKCNSEHDDIKWEHEKVDITSLDTLIKIHGAPSFIKIDVEGHELEVIKSLTNCSCPIAFEWAEEMKEEMKETIVYLDEILGYNRFYIQYTDKYSFVPNEYFYRSKNQILQIIEQQFVPHNQNLWGMIWCKKSTLEQESTLKQESTLEQES